jgi:pSer/pThr/pTyr-binding forkhead associated (FHA) protein
VITDLRSANGVELQGKRLAVSAMLADRDRLKIGDHEFLFELQPLTKA